MNAPDDIAAIFKTKTRHIAGLPEPAMRRTAVETCFSDLEPKTAVWWIDQWIRGALWGGQPELDAMIAFADWLIHLDEYDIFKTWFEAATEDDREAVLFLLRNPPPHRALKKNARLPEVRLPMERDTTMGERRTMARGQNREVFSRLLADPEPLVLREVLKNTSLQVSDVLQVAARRPTKPELLQEVLDHPRWFREISIREGVARNPFTSTGVALRLLPTLNIVVLRQLRNASDLHPLVHESAKLLVELREKRTAPWHV